MKNSKNRKNLKIEKSVTGEVTNELYENKFVSNFLWIYFFSRFCKLKTNLKYYVG